MFDNKTLIIEEFEININNNFAALDGLRILHFSDLHLVRRNQRFDIFFTKLNKIECDLAIVSGDLIDVDTGINACVEYLSGLRPRYGTFVILGNHDRYYGGVWEFLFFKLMKKFRTNNLVLLKSSLKDKEIVVLENEIAHLDIRDKRIKLIGIDCPLGYDRYGRGVRFKEEVGKLLDLVSSASKDDYNILIFHIPDLVQEFDTYNINLMLTSHTHGGQVRLPLIGPVIVQSTFQRKYSMGLFKYNHSYLHISSGIGVTSSAPVRFRCPPRASIIILKADRKKAWI